MKKILLATTAIVAMASVSSTASAAEKISLSLGGFMNQYVGLTDSDDAANTDTTAMSMGQRSSTEIYFRGETTLDNGLTVSVDVQREGDKGASGNDIASLTISSDAMGALTLGGTGHAADDFAVGAPMAGTLGFGDGVGDWTVANVAANAGFGGAEVGDLGGKELKIKYVSPSFSGVTVGFSYDAAANVNGQKAGALRSTTDDASSIAAMYEGEVGGASVSADIARFHNNADNRDVILPAVPAAGAGNDTTTDRIGLNVGTAGFTVGGSYSQINDVVANADGKAWDLGVSYETGPYAVSAAYMSGTTETGVASEAKTTEWVLGASYDLGASVSLVGNYFTAKGTDGVLADSKVSGLVAGIEVGF